MLVGGETRLHQIRETETLTGPNMTKVGGKIKTRQAETNSRWFRVAADYFDHELFTDDPFSKRDAWLWLIANAAWKARRVNHKGKMIDLARGQLIGGRSHLAEKWGWSEKAVRNYLQLLVSENMILLGQSDGHYSNILTICNYDKFQSAEIPEGQSKGQSGASAGPEKGQTLTNNTKDRFEGDARERPNEVEVGENETHVGHGVVVNCDTIRHSSFTISLPAIRMGTLASGLTADEVKTHCVAHALQWAAEIEGGKLSGSVVPGKIANFLSASIMGATNRKAAADAKKANPKPSMLELLRKQRAEAEASNVRN